MTPHQLSLFAMIYKSDEMKGAIDITAQDSEKLEKALVSRISEFSASEFSMICNTVREDSASLDKFLTEGQ